MKKILLASTALVASAGFAAAEVVVGGDGYFGVAYGEATEGLFSTPKSVASGLASDRSSYTFVYDLDIDFAVTLQSDSGLAFGMKTDLDDNASGSQGARGHEGEIFISGDFGRLAMGDIDGGAEVAVGDLAGVGLTGLGDYNETIYLLGAGASPAGPVARYDYSVSGITLSLGLTDDEGYAVGVGYATDLFSVGLGYESVAEGAEVEVLDTDILGGVTGSSTATVTLTDSATHIVGSASVTFSGVTLKGVYGQADIGTTIDKVDQYGVSVSSSFGAASVAAYYKAVDVSFLAAGTADRKGEFYGLGGAYDLGGGLSLKAGVSQADVDGTPDTVTVADFGVAINF